MHVDGRSLNSPNQAKTATTMIHKNKDVAMNDATTLPLVVVDAAMVNTLGESLGRVDGAVESTLGEFDSISVGTNDGVFDGKAVSISDAKLGDREAKMLEEVGGGADGRLDVGTGLVGRGAVGGLVVRATVGGGA